MPRDPLDEALASLPPCDVTDETARRIQRRGRRVLAREAALTPFVSAFWRVYGSLEPALLVATVVVYLGWALRSVADLLG